jgi:hypothetical protein
MFLNLKLKKKPLLKLHFLYCQCTSIYLSMKPCSLLAWPTKGKDIVFRFIIEYRVASCILAPR